MFMSVLADAKRYVAMAPESDVAESDKAEDRPPSKSVLIESRIGICLNGSFGFIERPCSLHGGYLFWGFD